MIGRPRRRERDYRGAARERVLGRGHDGIPDLLEFLDDEAPVDALEHDVVEGDREVLQVEVVDVGEEPFDRDVEIGAGDLVEEPYAGIGHVHRPDPDREGRR